MPKRTDIKKILIIGSGPIVIGQAAEFDYAGTQACLALKSEGYEVVLCNSNPATIMTDREIASKIYMEPLTLEFLARIVRKERPDGIIGTLGGQTGLNLVTKLAKSGVLEECNVEILGTRLESIVQAEDRDLFKKLCQKIGEPIVESHIATTIDQALDFANMIGYPVILRPAFTLGGTGGGFANNDEELKIVANSSIEASPVGQVLVEKSIKGYKEVEYEVMRDKNDTAIIVCNMENLEPVGVHTGDSIVVAPSQTLTNNEYQMLRDSSLKMIRALKIEGGCNIQFALDPHSDQYYIIEVNPRVSRSSALASKATGYPIAYVSAKIAIGYKLDEIAISTTHAAFEPTLDYIVTKIPRFPFDKFLSAERKLSTQMKATGEVMAIGRNFESSFLKAIRSMENKIEYLYLAKYSNYKIEKLFEHLLVITDETVFVIAEILRRKKEIQKIHDITKIDKWFLKKIENIIDLEKEISLNKNKILMLKKAKEFGFSDKTIADLWKTEEFKIKELRLKNKILPVYKMIDTCASEFEGYVPYFYSTYETENETVISKQKKVIILGSGPIRIGQGVEFDYSTVHCIWTLKKLGYKAIIINNNPETVSTDYRTSDKLYFEPLTFEDVMSVIDIEKPLGVICQLSGQTPLNIAHRLEAAGVKILGSDLSTIRKAEDRDLFTQEMKKIKVDLPKGKAVKTIAEGIKVANSLGYPVLIRPSFVLGGAGMQIIYDEKHTKSYLQRALSIDPNQNVLIDKYIIGKEVEVDAICDGKNVFIPGIMEQIEETGVHSGDSISVYPSFSLSNNVKKKIYDYTTRIGKQLKVIGLFNIQFVIDKNEKIYVIEVNPRASRSVPYLSKSTGINLVEIATQIIMGVKKAPAQSTFKEEKNMYYVKAPAFSFAKITGLDPYLAPEMKSTGESIGYEERLPIALYKALIASGMTIKQYGSIFISVDDNSKKEMLKIAKKFIKLDFQIYATRGTHNFLKKHGIASIKVDKVDVGSKDVISLIKRKLITYVLNITGAKDDKKWLDQYAIRNSAIQNNIPVITSLKTAEVLTDALEAITIGSKEF